MATVGCKHPKPWVPVVLVGEYTWSFHCYCCGEKVETVGPMSYADALAYAGADPTQVRVP